jgi:uncharacterized protein (DUF1800 family)
MAEMTTEAQIRRLLRRFGLGASEAEVAFYTSGGSYESAVDKLLNSDSLADPFPVETDHLRAGQNMRLSVPSMSTMWVTRMLMTRRPLVEKMTLFWHDHFATSGSKVNFPLLMHAQNELLRSHALGNFRDMLLAVAKDPAMIYWLDNQENVAGSPNENFARELFELFTLGIGHYTEQDIREAARAFTGWSLRRRGRQATAEFLFVPSRHDSGPKTVLGASGNLSGEDVIHHVCSLPRTADNICHKLVAWFVDANPPAPLVQRCSAVFRANKLQIKPVLKTIMLSKEFRDPAGERKVVKTPVDVVVATMRQLGIGENLRSRFNPEDNPRRQLLIADAAREAMRGMGMYLMFPPDVAGWEGAQGWISSATMVERMKWGERIFGQGQGRGRIPFPAQTLFERGTSVEDAVARIAEIFDVPVAPDRRDAVVAVARNVVGDDLEASESNRLAAAVAKVLFASPGFQFA